MELSLGGRIIKTGLKIYKRRNSQQKKSLDEMQEETLRKLLTKASKTEFGHFYQFEEILNADDFVAEFQRRVPIHDYSSMYAGWWHRLLNEEEHIVWPGKIKYFALSSGTTGAPSKFIPVSREMLSAMKKTSQFMFSHSTNLGLPAAFYGRKFLMLSSTTDFVKKGDLYIGDVSGINTSRMPYWLRTFYRPGKKITKIRDWNDRIEAIASQAKNWDICTIAGIPSWVQLMLERVISYHQVSDIHEIWPNFQVYVSGGVNFGPYRKRFEQLCSKPIITLDTYYSSEGCLACQTRLDNEGMPMELVLQNGVFFEFIPFHEGNFNQGNLKKEAKAVSIENVLEGEEYALILSSCSGAWRYLIGDTIKFVNVERAEIKITGRTKQFLSICGEHLSLDNMCQAIEMLEKEFDLIITEFTVKALKIENHFEHHWYLGVEKIIDSDRITLRLDRILSGLNDDYATERKDNLLKKIQVHLLDQHLFLKWMEKKGKLGGQAKFPKVMTDEQFQDWLQFIKNEK
jgi:hypothetical protein